MRNTFADLRDDAAALMAQHDGVAQPEAPDTALIVHGDVRAADAHGIDAELNVLS